MHECNDPHSKNGDHRNASRALLAAGRPRSAPETEAANKEGQGALQKRTRPKQPGHVLATHGRTNVQVSLDWHSGGAVVRHGGGYVGRLRNACGNERCCGHGGDKDNAYRVDKHWERGGVVRRPGRKKVVQVKLCCVLFFSFLLRPQIFPAPEASARGGGPHGYCQQRPHAQARKQPATCDRTELLVKELRLLAVGTKTPRRGPAVVS